VPTVRRLVTSLITSRGCDVILTTSQCSESLHSETRTRINQCGPFKQVLKENIVLKHERIWITTAGEEAFHATALRHFS